jgi:hypothetical protein
MQLRSARLCLDCEEIHEDQQSPLCASESFASLTRWIPAESNRPAPRPVRAVAPKPTSDLRWIRRGAAGVAILALSRWLWRQGDRPVDDRR